MRTHFGKDAVIVANWYGKEVSDFKIEGADHTLFGDINDQACREQIKSINNGKYDYLFYATALGEVGIPIKDATQEQIDKSNQLSFDPIPRLEGELEIGTVVAYSTFYTIRQQPLEFQCSYQIPRGLDRPLHRSLFQRQQRLMNLCKEASFHSDYKVPV